MSSFLSRFSPAQLLVVAILGIGFSIGFTWWQLGSSGPRIPVERSRVMGDFAAEEIASVLKGQGSVALLVFDVEDIPMQDTLSAQLESALPDQGIAVAGTHKVPVEGDVLNLYMIQEVGFDPEQMRAARTAFPDVDAFVSLIGVPRTWPKKTVPLMLVPHHGDADRVDGWISSGRVAMALVAEPNRERALELAKETDLAVWMRSYYDVRKK